MKCQYCDETDELVQPYPESEPDLWLCERHTEEFWRGEYLSGAGDW